MRGVAGIENALSGLAPMLRKRASSWDDNTGGAAAASPFDPSIPLPAVDDRPIRYTIKAHGPPGGDAPAVELVITEKPPLGVVWESGAILCAALQVGSPYRASCVAPHWPACRSH